MKDRIVDFLKKHFIADTIGDTIALIPTIIISKESTKYKTVKKAEYTVAIVLFLFIIGIKWKKEREIKNVKRL